MRILCFFRVLGYSEDALCDLTKFNLVFMSIFYIFHSIFTEYLLKYFRKYDIICIGERCSRRGIARSSKKCMTFGGIAMKIKSVLAALAAMAAISCTAVCASAESASTTASTESVTSVTEASDPMDGNPVSGVDGAAVIAGAAVVAGAVMVVAHKRN